MMTNRSRVFTPLLLASLACASGGSRAGAGSSRRAAFDLVVVSTTDVHGRIRGWDYYGDSAESVRGLTRAATIVDSVRAANPGRAILLDGGDLLQGNPFAYVAARATADTMNPIIAAMNAMHYDAAAIGNHEYNYGVPYLDRAVRQARFPMLSANTLRPDGSHAFRPWTIVERRGVKVGIVGATTPGVMLWDRENVRGRVTLGDIVPAVRAAVSEVKAAGADIVLVTVHSGLDEPSSYDTVASGLPSENVARRVAQEVDGIDLVLYGHSHKEQPELKIGRTLLVQPKNWATSVSVATLSLSREAGRWHVVGARGTVIPARAHAEEPALLALTEAAHRRTVTYANTPVGTTPVAWRGGSARLVDTPLIDFILEVERKASGADLASTAAFTLDAKLDSGDITVAELAQLYPYDNTLRAIRISGRQLRDYLEFSSRYYTGSVTPAGVPATDPQIPGYNFDIVAGADYTIDLTRPIGSRITLLTFKGRPVAETDSFTLALNNYRQTGGSGYAMIRNARVVYDQQQELRQLLIDEVKRRGTIKPSDYFQQNWAIVYAGSNRSNARSTTGGPASASIDPSAPRLRIIATNDFHGGLEPRPDAAGVMRGGAAYTATEINRARRECASPCESILLDAGDLFQGTAASNLAFGRPVMDYYNRMGYAATTIGNHEFDWGQDTLRARMRQAHFPMLAANINYKTGGDVRWIPDDTIIRRGSLNVGIVGIATPLTPTTTHAENVADLRFDDPAKTIDAHARALRARGAGIVIVIEHDGAFCDSGCHGEITQVAARITEKVDAIVSGHTHTAVDWSVNGIPIVQARSSGRAVGIIDIPVVGGRATGRANVEVRDVTTSIAPDPGVDSLVRKATAKVAGLINQRIAELAEPLAREGNQYALGNLIADAQRWAGKGDVAVMNNGGIRTGMQAGVVTYGMLYEVQPFGNTLYRVKMSGKQLREYLERLVSRDEPGDHVSGVTIGYNPELPRGQRIVSLTLPAGRTIADAASYNVVMNDFMVMGGDERGPPAGAEKTPLGMTDLEALIAYLKTLPSPVHGPADKRIFILQ
jgi:2',3'-cyclic-nucleotide 2'-phosphodiesterase/3'-nucleotidase/5'-nucleotidase